MTVLYEVNIIVMETLWEDVEKRKSIWNRNVADFSHPLSGSGLIFSNETYHSNSSFSVWGGEWGQADPRAGNPV